MPLPAVSVPPEIVKGSVPVFNSPPPVSVRVFVPRASDWLAAGFSTLRVLVVTAPVSVVLAVIRELAVLVVTAVGSAVSSPDRRPESVKGEAPVTVVAQS